MATGLGDFTAFLGPLTGTLATIGKALMIVLVLAVILALLFVVIWYFLRPMMYTIDVVISVKRQGNAIFIGKDKARLSRRRDGIFGMFGNVVETQVHLLKRKIYLPTPTTLDYVYANDGKNSQGTIFFRKFGDMDYAYCVFQVDEQKVVLKPVDTDSQAWWLHQRKTTRERNNVTDFFSRNQVLIASGMIMIIIVAVLWWSKTTLAGVTSGIADSASQLASSLEALNQCRVN